MKALKVLNLIILSVILVSFTASVPESEYFVPKRASSIFSCRLNTDNYNDLIMGHLTESDSNTAISLLKNNGEGLFILYDTSYLFIGYVEDIFATIINNDSFPDIIAEHADFSNGVWQFYVRVLYNDGNGNFPNYVDFLHTGNYVFTGITSGDINGDQHQDVLVIINYYDQKYWGIFYNDGQGNLLSPVYYNLSFFPQDIKVEDLNNDGRDDIVITGNNTEVFYSIDTGFQTQLLNASLTMMVHIADMNHDDNKDIITLNGLFGQTTIYIYDGSQNFSLIAQKQMPFGSYRTVTTDLNNDSFPDLLILPYNNDGIFAIYNTGDFTLDSIQFISLSNVGENRRFAFCADLDGNGFNDIAMVRDIGGTGTTIENLVILFNDGQGHFLPDPITYIQMGSKISENSLKIYPIPFHERITFDIKMNALSFTTLTIYDINGNKIKRLLDNNLKCGHYLLSWDGIDDKNNSCLPGIYFACLNVNGEMVLSQKIVKN